jgi:hypothetical protein
MRSKSRTSFFVVNARDPRRSALAHAFYPQNAGLKQLTRTEGNRCPRRVSVVRPGERRDGGVKSIVPGWSGASHADEIAMTEENDSVLGNLPRSRPGVRSDKRASGRRAGGAGGPAGSPPAPKAKPSTKPKVSAASKPGARAAKPRPAARKAPPPPPARSGTDPVGLAVKTAGSVAETGLKVASRVAGEVLRRLPRP